jgi:very-short-patch-repair endonuclease
MLYPSQRAKIYSDTLRRNAMPSEQMLESAMRKQRWLFTTQAMLRKEDRFYIADFLIELVDARMVIEVDGPSHYNRKQYDADRDRWIWQQFRYRIIRFHAHDILTNLPRVLGIIRAYFPKKH